MKLSTSTNLICERPDGKLLPLKETLNWIAQTDIHWVDMSFYEYSYEGGIFLSDQWKPWIEEAAETAARLGLAFWQSHAYTYDFLDPRLSDAEIEQREMLVERSMECCRILGAKVLVTHPSTARAAESIPLISAGKNRAYLERYAELVDKYGMSTAVENVFCYPGESYRFFCDPAEILSFITELNDPRIGICWDLEHGAIMKMDQPSVLRAFGKHLSALHVSDTVTDRYEPFMHMLPFTGETDWEQIRKALIDIQYEGAYSFEVHNFLKRIPDSLIQPALHYVNELGKYLTRTEN